jgi:hypothetical protein
MRSHLRSAYGRWLCRSRCTKPRTFLHPGLLRWPAAENVRHRCSAASTCR